MGDRVLAASPAFANPLFEASEIAITGRTEGLVAQAQGYANHGEPVRCVRTTSGKITEIWLGANQLLPAARVAREMEKRYGRPARLKRHQ